MKKIIIIGCPGSGKSTFARQLQKIVKLPLYYLDMLYWNTDKTTVPKDVFRQRLSEVLKKDEWIIDGNYKSTMEWRLAECDTVFFLDYPTETCIQGIKERVGTVREDMPWVEETVDEEFLGFVKDYNYENRPEVLKLLEKYPEKNVIIFKSRVEADTYLNNLIV